MAIHDQNHGIDSTVDHGGLDGGVEDNLLSVNASGLPQDSGISTLEQWVSVPATKASTGVKGQLAYTTGYLWKCVATDTWDIFAGMIGTLFKRFSVTAGITASATQSQGQQVLLTDINEISTCGTSGDVVTMPSAVAGMKITIINNGAQSADVYPSTGDNLGAGVNTAVALASAGRITYVAYDTTNWATI